MILTFSKIEFRNKYLECTKIHTIRGDKFGRWKEGMKIHLWLHNPRNKSKNPYCFGNEKCISIQYIGIEPFKRQIGVDGNYLTSGQIQRLIKNDGFDDEREFWEWFNKPFYGIIIHWTNTKYQ